ncbi:protein-export chaperone SecB [Kordiimonas sp. SCSIO 12610]|uniref:protein-export chaperone SecB n=1 Tax=Kordiimonas sp. SCSIO 12610 TaxID=2829597 RepID=UPI00210CDB36|nr:protein-export chaperone SecB [Kordiimonas sp. SCSIO 12610]UTW55444.1 protein-export chaperone SecB [Kordiimonas sp. SCSIO 12610]
MAENDFQNNQTPVGGPAPEGAEAPQAGVLAQYIKDLSFENPNAPASLQNQAGNAPAIDVNVNVGVRQMNEEVYEVDLKISAKATTPAAEEGGEGTVAFVVELSYGALFGIRNVPQDALRGFLLVQAPMLMFPFARRIIADASRDGGFPPLLLEPINFDALYRAQLAQEAQNAGGEAAPAADGDAPAPINLN